MLRKLTILLAVVLALVAVLASGAAAHRDDARFPGMRLTHKGELVQRSAPGWTQGWTHKDHSEFVYEQPFLWPPKKMVETGRYTIILEHPVKPSYFFLVAHKAATESEPEMEGSMKLHRKLVPIYRGDNKVDAWGAKFNINRPHRPYYMITEVKWPKTKGVHSYGGGERDFYVETR